MTPPVLDTAADGLGSLREGAARDPKGLWKFLTIVGCVAVLSALVYLLSTRSVTEDRYTGADATRDWKANEATRSTNLLSLATQRAQDLKAQADINARLENIVVRNSALMEGIDRRLIRIETKLDAK